jgi:hypothetical protein
MLVPCNYQKTVLFAVVSKYPMGMYISPLDQPYYSLASNSCKGQFINCEDCA